MIRSFQIDHTKLKPGLYVSRTDIVGFEVITTFDIRICEPNKEMMTPAISHTIEHLMADFLRNESPLKEDVLYFGPMGCLTGFYLIVKRNRSSLLIKDHIVDAFRYCSFAETIPGATQTECGNYTLNDLKGAKETCRRFSAYLKDVNKECLIYPE